MNRTLILSVIVAALVILSQGLSLSHDQVAATAAPAVAPTATANTATPATTTTTAATTTTTAAADANPYHTWDYIKGRKMSLNHCFHVLPADEDTLFEWQDTNPQDPTKKNLHISGKCGTADCSFTMVHKEFTFGSCTPATLAAPCADYIARISRSHHVSLVSNLIKFFSTDDTKVVPNFVLADRK